MTGPDSRWGRLSDTIATIEANLGPVGVAVIAPDGGRFSHNGDRRFKAASTVKIPLMVEIFRQIDRGERRLDDHYALADQDRAAGGGVMAHLHTGMNFTLNDLIYLMISISDNTATNTLIDYAGMEAVTATMRHLGMTNSNLSRKMKGRPAQGDEQENWATPNDYLAVVKAILEGSAASSDACERMVAMLKKQSNARRIGRYVPVRDDVTWGSKTGSIKGATNDVGFIRSSEGTMIISVFCEGFPDLHSAEKAIGDIARAAMSATGVVEPLQTS